MTKHLTYKGESFLSYSEIHELVQDSMKKRPRLASDDMDWLADLRHKIENKWVNLNIHYDKGGGHFSNAMSEYYIHFGFEYIYGTTLN